MNAFSVVAAVGSKLLRRPQMFTALLCGHKTPREGVVKAHDAAITMQVPLNMQRKPYLCLDCLGQRAIRCAWCARTIFVGEAVTLFAPPSGVEVGPQAILYSSETGEYVGCLHPDCLPETTTRVGQLILSVTTGEAYVGEVELVRRAYEAAKKSSRWNLNRTTQK